MEKHTIRIVAIAGSVRPGNFTSKALAVVLDELGKLEDVEVDLIDPAQYDLKLPGQAANLSVKEELQAKVSDAAALVLATPEYHGSYSSVMKLVIEHLGFPSVMSGKPVALLGVAAGAIGAIKALEHLRSVCSHVGSIVLPGPVSIAGVNKVFNDEGHCMDTSIDKRLRGLARNLDSYVRANLCPRITLEQMVREDGES